MLKNFTVVAESIKSGSSGLMDYAHYLKDENHPNHKNKTIGIFSVHGNENHINNILQNAFNYDLQNAGQKNHRKLSSYAHSFMLSIPKTTENFSIRPTEEQWKKINKDLMRYVFKKMDVDIMDDTKRKELSKMIFSNVHQQKAGNDHLNFVIGNVFQGERITNDRIVKRKTKDGVKEVLLKPNLFGEKHFLEGLKRTYNASLLNHVGLDHKKYNPDTPRDTRLNPYEFTTEKLKNASKLFKNTATYLGRFFKSIEESDLVKSKKNLVRIDNNLSKLEDLKEDLTVDESLDYSNAMSEIKKFVDSREDAAELPESIKSRIKPD